MKDAAVVGERLDRLTDLKGHAVEDDWKARVHAGQIAVVVAELLEKHYAPGYETSTARNFRQYPAALKLALSGPDADAMAQAASTLLQGSR
ncbi:MAG: hypothetical protein ACKOBF_12070 [Limnohabitans sp.]